MLRFPAAALSPEIMAQTHGYAGHGASYRRWWKLKYLVRRWRQRRGD